MAGSFGHRVVARNAAQRSENKIHEDGVARAHGFRGGLVPGVTLYAYLMHPVLEAYGRPWLESGAVSTSFRSPVYEGSLVEARGEWKGPAGNELALSLLDAEGAECVTGAAGKGGVSGVSFDWVKDVVSVPPADLPAERPEAGAESLVPGTVLGSLWEASDSPAYAGYLDLLRQDLGLCGREGLVHPGRLVLSANSILAANVRLGPWVHVGTDLLNLAAVPEPALIETRARVSDRYERRGHQFVQLDVVWRVGERPVAAARHTAIYRLRTPG